MEITFNKEKIDYPLLQQKGLTFGEDVKACPVFHYTSIGGLQGILSNKTLHFTNIKYLNDKGEILAGLESLAKESGFSEEQREEFYSSILNRGTQTFLCCFSLDGDSLPMWNYYTKEINNQGFNIAFDSKELVESILKNNPVLDGCDFAFGNVDYSMDNESQYSKTIKNGILSSMELAILKLCLAVAKNAPAEGTSNIDESVFKGLEEKIRQSEKMQKANLPPVYSYNGRECTFKSDLEDSLCFIKRDYFTQEKEFRIAITVPDELLPKMARENVYRFRISHGALIPYIQLNFSEEVVKSITISPTVQSDLVEQSIQDFINYCQYNVQDFSTFIKHSKVPVRF